MLSTGIPHRKAKFMYYSTSFTVLTFVMYMFNLMELHRTMYGNRGDNTMLNCLNTDDVAKC